MRVVYLDFETYYDKDYSLRKLTLEEYIRDPRYETLMMGYAVNDGEVQIAIGRDGVAKALRDLQLNAPDTVTVGHNAIVEGSVIEWRFGERINTLYCTMSMARATGVDRLAPVSLEGLAKFFNKLGLMDQFKGDEIDNMQGKRLKDFTPEGLKDAAEYCRTDVEITRSIFKLLLPYMYDGGLTLIDATMRMFTRPMFKLNVPLLREYRDRIITGKDERLNALAQQIGMKPSALKTAVRSTVQFPKLFAELTGRELPMKVSAARTETFKKRLASLETDEERRELMEKTAGLQVINGEYIVYSPATAKDDLEFQDLLRDSDPIVSGLANTKMDFSSTIHETRATRLIEAGQRGLLPVTLIFASAHTGRYGGGGKLNLQNLPSRGDRSIRESLTAPSGYSLVAGDSSQIEARLLAYIANQRDVLEIFASGGDVYAHMGAAIYNIPYETIVEWRSKPTEGLSPEDVEMVNRCKMARTMGKEAVLASGYQMSGRAFAIRLKSQGTIIKPLDGRELVGDEIDAFHESEANRINFLYRDTNGMITALWRRCQTVLDELVAGGSGVFGGPNDNLLYYGHRDMYGMKVPGIRLPTGFWLLYPNLKKEYNEATGYEEFSYRYRERNAWITSYVYGGKVTENITQALAFSVLQDQARLLIDRGVPLILNIHDEWATCVPTEKVAEVVAKFEECMSVVPWYVEGCPLACEVDFGSNYGEV